jgi:hypothetical protein
MGSIFLDFPDVQIRSPPSSAEVKENVDLYPRPHTPSWRGI